MFNFEKLLAYQETKKLAKTVLAMVDRMGEADEVLKKQIKKSVIDVPSVIAEGMSHATNKEKIQYLDTAYCSLAKVYTQMQLASDLTYISEEDMSYVSNGLQETGKIVLGLKRKLRGEIYDRRDDSREEGYSHEEESI